MLKTYYYLKKEGFFEMLFWIFLMLSVVSYTAVLLAEINVDNLHFYEKLRWFYPFYPLVIPAFLSLLFFFLHFFYCFFTKDKKD